MTFTEKKLGMSVKECSNVHRTSSKNEILWNESEELGSDRDRAEYCSSPYSCRKIIEQ